IACSRVIQELMIVYGLALLVLVLIVYLLYGKIGFLRIVALITACVYTPFLYVLCPWNVGNLSAVILGGVGEEALSGVRAQKENALAAAHPADVSRVRCWYLLITACTVVLAIGDRLKALVFPSVELD